MPVSTRRWVSSRPPLPYRCCSWLSVQAALARNAALITRALAAVPVAFVFTGCAVAIVAALLGVTDWACQAISGQTGPNSRAFFGDVAKGFSTITDDSGPTGAAPALFVALLASIFAALAALAVWVELVIRSAGIYVCVLFFPVVLVARIWPKLEKWATRLAEALTALILSKFVIVAVLSVAAAAVADSRASEGFNGVLAAGALLVFAAFAPLVLFRLVQFADPQIHARGGNAGTLARGGQTTMSAAQAARISMDRHTGGGGLPNASAAEMARGPVSAAAGGVALGSSSGGRGGGHTAAQAGSSAGSPVSQTSAGTGSQSGGGAALRAGAPLSSAPSGTAEVGSSAGRSQRASSATGARPARREAGATDRRPADLDRPRPGQDGGAGK